MKQCSALFDTADGVFEEWNAADSTLLNRYAALVALPAWREPDTLDVSLAWIPSFSRAMDGQKLLLLRARELASRGDEAAVRALLESDLQFWRMVLASSDFVLSKMMATAAIRRHFEWGNLVLRKLPASEGEAAIPDSWREAISDTERSMDRCMVGEWMFLVTVLNIADGELEAGEGSTSDWVSDALIEPLYQPQHTLNEFAEYYWNVAHAFQVPLHDYSAAMTRVSAQAQQRRKEKFPFGRIYNLTGEWLQGISSASIPMAEYAVRVGDIEGVRRAALTAATLRASQVETENVPASLAAAEVRDPYTDRPFGWDAQERAIVFRGLAPGERGEYRIDY
jgi:hypothetical protein